MKPRLKKDYWAKVGALLTKLQPYRLEGLAILLALSAIFLTLKPGLWSSDNALYIAVVGPMRGTDRAEGDAMVKGIRLLLEQVNRDGGIHGKQVKLLEFDDRNNPELAKQRAGEIAREQKVHIVLGHFSGAAALAAGTVYQEQGIPVITGNVRENEVTEGNAWYFRTTYSLQSQAIFLAYYVKNVLEQKTVSLISSLHPRDTSLTGTFEQTFQHVGGEINNTWYFNSETQELEQEIDFLIGNIAQALDKDTSEMLLLSVGENALARIIAALKRQDIKIPLLTDYETLLKADFSEYSEKRKQPGYFLDGIYVTSPFIFFDATGANAQKFQEQLEETYARKPGMAAVMTAALYYDAALTAIQAMRDAEVQGDREQIGTERQQIRDYLASLRTIQDAIPGITGPIYFDKDGNAERPVTFGVFEKRNVISALTQLKRADTSRISSISDETKAKRLMFVNSRYMYKTHIVNIGIDLREVSSFDVENLTCTLDFDLWFRYQGQLDVENIEFLNAVDPSHLSSEPQEGNPATLRQAQDTAPLRMTLSAEQVSGGITYRLYRVKGRFKADFLPSQPVFFREHVLGLSFRHNTLTRNNLIYVPDTLFMAQIGEQSFWGKLRKAQILRSVPDWTIDTEKFFQDNYEIISLANPKNLKLRKWTENYSRFNAGIWLRKDEFTLRGIISTFQNRLRDQYVNPLLLVSVVLVLLFFLVKKMRRLAYFSKVIWCVEALCIVLLMLSAERALTNFLTRGKLVLLIFDVLWWIVGAFLLILAVDRFIWMPLRKRTERPVPRILRHFVSFMICLFAFFGIFAFVFGRDVNSLVATSGILTLILAFASKVDITNIFAGIGISFSQPFRIDDWVKIGDCEEGQVIDMTSRTTKIQTRDYSMLSIPNTAVASSVIENFNYPDARFRLQFTLETFPIYHPERVQKVLLDAVFSTDGVLKEPTPQILFKGQGDSSAIYTVVFYINDYGKKFVLKQAVWKRVWIHLERAGIDLATPRREILMVQENQEDVTSPQNVIRHVDLFDPLPENAKVALSEKMQKHYFPSGETIVKQGESGKSLFIILEGSVGLWVQSEDGKPIEVSRLGCGDVFGEMQLLTGKTRRFGVISMTDTFVYQIMKEDIALFIQKNPELAERFSKKLSERQMVINAQKEVHDAQKIDKEALSSQILGKIQQFFGVKEKLSDTISSSQDTQDTPKKKDS